MCDRKLVFVNDSPILQKVLNNQLWTIASETVRYSSSAESSANGMMLAEKIKHRNT